MNKHHLSNAKAGWFKPEDIGETTQAFYEKEGFLVVEGALSEEELRTITQEAVSLCRGERGDVRFGKQAGEIDFDVLAKLEDDEVIKKFLCIHNAHKISESILNSLSQRVVVDVLKNVIGPNVKCMQSMLFIKSAGKPGQAWHQDEDYIPTRDRSLCGAWIALDDATIDNGCLWVIPGSHRAGVLYPQFPQDDERFDCAWESYDFPHQDEEAVPVEVKAGSVVFFNGYLLHRSLPNKTKAGFRRALVNHYMSAESFLPWRHKENTTMAKTDFRDIVMVAGRDPYAWKGLENTVGCHVRPDGQGGCGDGRNDLETWKTAASMEERVRR